MNEILENGKRLENNMAKALTHFFDHMFHFSAQDFWLEFNLLNCKQSKTSIQQCNEKCC